MFVIKCQLSACKNKDQNACGSPLTMDFSVKFVINIPWWNRDKSLYEELL